MSYYRLTKNLLHSNNRFQYLKRWPYSSFTTKCAVKYDTGSRISGYFIKEINEVPELNLTAIYLEHKITGASHLHLTCDDSNNFFGVALKTVPHNDTGVPHILEHLSLCGSQRYPCKDPFMNMRDRSLSTFMNAFTGSDYTMYGFSSQNAKDFQNLLSVYLDAVYFPLLSEMDFKQEGWRLEHENVHDKNSPIILKGVVFNEMKGVFSDNNNLFGMKVQNSIFPSNTYSCNFGGDPLVIPSLTWKDLKEFHAHFYHPSNSRFITYGNLPLEDHLHQIEESVLQHFNKIIVENDIPNVERWKAPKELHIHSMIDPMAAVPENQTILSNTYLLENITNTYENFALSILGNLLIDGPNAPFYQSLLESGLAPDYSPYAGFESHLKESLFSIGVREIAEGDIDHAKETIENTFENAMRSGFPVERVQSILHRIELSTKHRTSNFGLSLAMGVNHLWNHLGNPITSLKVNDHVHWFQKQLKDNPHFLQDKIAQYFKNNNHKLTLVMTPIENFENERLLKEETVLKSKLEKLSEADKIKIFNDGLLLEKHQQNVDISCLPTLKISDVNKDIERTPLSFIAVGNVEVQLCEQPTNEIIYFNAFVDSSSVPEEYVMLLPLFCSVVTEMGAGKRNYKELDQAIQLKTGGFNVSFGAKEHPMHPDQFENGVLFSSYCLEKNVDDMFSLWGDIFNELCLEDHNHLSQLIKLDATNMSQSISHAGHAYSMRKASSCLSACANLREKTSGLSQVTFMKNLAADTKSHEEVLNKIRNLSKYLLQKNKMRCSLNAMPSGMSSALNSLDSFLSSLSTNSVSSIRKDCEKSPENNAHFVLPLSVNYVGQSILTVPYCHKDHASLQVVSKLMSSKFLHREIREKGGAYGGGVSLSTGGLFMYYSYRDPNILKTLNSFEDSVNWIIETNHSDQDIDEAKLGVFGSIDAPIPPQSKGFHFFKERISDEMKQELRKGIFSCTKEDIINASKKYLRNAVKGTALIGPENDVTKSDSTKWKIIEN